MLADKSITSIKNSPSKVSPYKSKKEYIKSFSVSQMPKKPTFVTPEELKVESRKGYLPKRFNINDRIQPITYNQSMVLGKIENQVDELDQKFAKTIDVKQQNTLKEQELQKIRPSQKRLEKPHDFKNKPLRRHENDFIMYKEIFVQPKQNRLNNLKEKEREFEELFHTGTQKQYDKILHIYDEDKEKTKQIPKYQEILQKDQNDQKYNSIVYSNLKEDFSYKQGQKLKDLPDRKQLEKQIHENLQILEQKLHMDKNAPEPDFFDQQIEVQPPDLPNATIASPLSPGNGYAPSVPLTHNFKDSKTNIKDLLVKAKAGMQAGDIQKESHLSFYLGMVYESNKNYKEAIKYYRKFMTCARMIEDKIGLHLATNRIAVNYYKSKNYEQAIEYHKQNIQLSDMESAFAGFYNIGIAYRKVENYEESILNFKKALDWARQRDEVESECLAYGQLGVTYNEAQAFEEALDNFTNCHDLSLKLKNTKLQLDCLLSITKITSLTHLKNSDSSIKVLKDAVDCAKQLKDNKTQALCLCNLGVLEGGKNFESYAKDFIGIQNYNNNLY
ncbi:hypothetical protein PPERSA_12880 [Pseudocohnilembus persalinus]|uniref:Uncharacterized protein n=1 Tax=Pseudocohnilembus persalinus TaxID=266149 RepID=A0A0V0Q899_PSEPJ|nr:hypothetical protein PPERSA_12880 [Pseudocohnilembus persalinus]|eukprot:KRW98401.1 hypothetical protein PPERSA_12880 [Pseudocohnilembus persalinus]